MNALLVVIASLYVIGAPVFGIAAWKREFHDHLGDPLLASMGLLLSIVFGLTWPLWLAVTPLVVALHYVGKWIVRNSA